MRHIDFAPLYRSTVGFDHLFSMLDGRTVPDNSQSYPPYNIERTAEDAYRVTVAVAGFGSEDLSIEARENVLTIKGGRPEGPEDAAKELLYRGIAGRAFERRFQLAEHVEVKGARLKNGLLHIDLERIIPEAKKPRRIEIATADNANERQIEADAA